LGGLEFFRAFLQDAEPGTSQYASLKAVVQIIEEYVHKGTLEFAKLKTFSEIVKRFVQST
jgi:hypothetical protein